GRLAQAQPLEASRRLCRGIAGTDLFEALAQDHRKVLALFDRIEATDSATVMRRAGVLL
ncbi:MAG: hypothetical protein JOY83_16715, partial [Alphaproteobacteria bacterium]|nr:hypothetical protein [Alphaproteobacteria bacterium]